MENISFYSKKMKVACFIAGAAIASFYYSLQPAVTKDLYLEIMTRAHQMKPDDKYVSFRYDCSFDEVDLEVIPGLVDGVIDRANSTVRLANDILGRMNYVVHHSHSVKYPMPKFSEGGYEDGAVMVSLEISRKQ